MHPPPNDTSGSDLSPRQVEILITIERTGAGLSMVAITLTLLSFFLCKKLQTTPNIFIMLASIANAGASIASMIGYDGLDKGEKSTLCQGQGFIFEWFMQSDPWWSFAMAFNVFLVFFNNANPAVFRNRIWIYCIICFGGPLIPAIVLVSIHDNAKGPVFGNAASLTRKIDHYGTATTEVQVTSITPENDYSGLPAIPPAIYAHGPTIVSHGKSWVPVHGLGYYSPEAYGKSPYQNATVSARQPKQPSTVLSRLRHVKSNASLKLKRLDPVKMAYLRTSFIFGFAILITWIPSSVNRLYSLTYHGRVNFQLSVASGCVLPLQGVWNALIYFTTS
ncbi:hypothetical protein ACHAPE_002138 [Trichoderma viride]